MADRAASAIFMTDAGHVIVAHWAAGGDQLLQICAKCPPTVVAIKVPSGAWTEASLVPSPVVGAGLPGLLLASLGCAGWRRRARR